MASWNCRQSWKRRSGSFSSERATTSASRLGKPGLRPVRGGAGVLQWATSAPAKDSTEKGGCPASISYSTQPKL